MMRGIRPQPSPRRRAGLESEQLVPAIRWDGRVPAEHRAAFAHKLLPPSGDPAAARWRGEALFHPEGGHWWIEGREGAGQPAQLSREGWGYGGPLQEGATAALRGADLYALLRAAIAAAGSQDAWARSVPVSPSQVSEVLGGGKPFSPRMLAALGVERVVTYRRLDPVGQPGDATAIVAALSKKDRRTLLWLLADGSPRRRTDVAPGEWRPLLDQLRRLRALRLDEETAGGWAATDAGLAARAALMRDEGRKAHA